MKEKVMNWTAPKCNPSPCGGAGLSPRTAPLRLARTAGMGRARGPGQNKRGRAGQPGGPIPGPRRRPGGGIASCITFPTLSTCRGSCSYASRAPAPGYLGFRDCRCQRFWPQASIPKAAIGSGPDAPSLSNHRPAPWQQHAPAALGRRLRRSCASWT